MKNIDISYTCSLSGNSPFYGWFLSHKVIIKTFKDNDFIPRKFLYFPLYIYKIQNIKLQAPELYKIQKSYLGMFQIPE